MLIDVFSGKEVTKVIDFLIDNIGVEYTKTDIATGSSVSRPTVQEIVQKLLQMNIVLPTRRLGHTELYSLNTKSSLVKSLVAFDTELSNILFEEGLESSDGLQTEISEDSSASSVNAGNQIEEMYSHFQVYGWSQTQYVGVEHHAEKNTVPVLHIPRELRRTHKTQEA